MKSSLGGTSLDIIQNTLLYLAEKLTAACLKLDPGTRARLQELNGKCIAFIIRDQVPYYQNGITIFVMPTLAGIELSADNTYVADASIALYAKDLLPLLQRADIPENLLVEGDHELLLKILDIVKQIDLDWEQAIAPVTGDVFAHQIGARVRETEKWLSQSIREARRLTREYLDEELPVAKQSPSFKPFFESVEKIKSAGNSLRDGWMKK
jgi:ubiquinone biosynthesis protein UbiJ